MPTREVGYQTLRDFVPSAGRAYATTRNFDRGPSDRSNVSTLSPYIRHRLITEHELISAVLAQHSVADAERFIQEVCWRTYWKGWLEQRPQFWTAYLNDVRAARERLGSDTALALAAAERGETTIECFNIWARELIEIGYLHNHARMWFASIWIFTLRLPWHLGADFFMRNLLDGDPASNTLSWRWVAGLHTRGKSYLARPDNIATYTNDRIKPLSDELVASATAMIDAIPLDRVALRTPDVLPNLGRVVLLITEDDLSPETWPLADVRICGVALYRPEHTGPPLSSRVRTFKHGAMADAIERAAARWEVKTCEVVSASEVAAFAHACGAECAVTTLVTVGYLTASFDGLVAAAVSAGCPIKQLLRPWDRLFWPHANAGFFKLKERIPAVLATLALTT